MEITIAPYQNLLDEILKLNFDQQIIIIEKVYENLRNKIKPEEKKEEPAEQLPDWLVESLDNQMKLLKKG